MCVISESLRLCNIARTKVAAEFARRIIGPVSWIAEWTAEIGCKEFVADCSMVDAYACIRCDSIDVMINDDRVCGALKTHSVRLVAQVLHAAALQECVLTFTHCKSALSYFVQRLYTALQKSYRKLC